MTWVLTLVARTPQESGPPLLEDVEPLHFTNLSYSDVLNEDGECQFSVNPESLGPDARQRLRDLAAFPCEIRVNHDDRAVWAGPVWGYQRQGETITVNCRGLLGHTRHMALHSLTREFPNVDQHLIAKELIDIAQLEAWQHAGLDTSTITASGVTRERTYDRAERHVVYERLIELTQVVGGFDLWVDPATREVHAGAKGVDRSGEVFLDYRNITDAGMQVSVAPSDVASKVWAVGTGETPIFTLRTNQALLESFGASVAVESFDGVSVSATLQAHADKVLAERSGQLFVPGAGVMPMTDADVTDFATGDVVSLSYDFGLGLVEATHRVAVKRVQVSESAQVSMSVEFT